MFFRKACSGLAMSVLPLLVQHTGIALSNIGLADTISKLSKRLKIQQDRVVFTFFPYRDG